LRAQIATEAETQPDMKCGRDNALDEAAAREAQVQRPTVTIASAFQIKFVKGTALKFAISIAVLAVLAAGGITLFYQTREPAFDWPAYVKREQEEAAKGDAMAMYGLGVRYANGEGVPQDYAKSREWYEKAAARGNVYAMNSLGRLYFYGNGVATDYAKAREWYEKAADMGEADAMVQVGKFYANGQGVAQDYAKAREWYEKAAAKGDPDAIKWLDSRGGR
jgi:TPR repeat protein